MGVSWKKARKSIQVLPILETRNKHVESYKVQLITSGSHNLVLISVHLCVRLPDFSLVPVHLCVRLPDFSLVPVQLCVRLPDFSLVQFGFYHLFVLVVRLNFHKFVRAFCRSIDFVFVLSVSIDYILLM